MKRLLTLSLLGILLSPTLPALSQSAQPNIRSYIGLGYRTLPQGFKDTGGWVVKGGRYRADLVQRGNTRMVWFNRALPWNRGGAVPVRVVDVMELPTFPKSQALHFAFCRLNGVNDREIFAIAEATDDDIRTNIVQAWRANTKTEKIEPISTKGISCPHV
ncbi:hypothetical protein ACQ4M3_41105 [Leptolyngbya sp. AN03gr2]|uniref:hypothetical protein n=1 Tax=unclassified Leptolyngbya TaxID=2650499 RepID=UPI003D32194D